MSASEARAHLHPEPARQALDPKLAEYLRSTALEGRTAPSAGSVKEARDQLVRRAAQAPPGRELASVVDHFVDAPDRTIQVRSYAPTEAVATIVYFHGGGWVIGSIETFDRLCRELAYNTGARVVSAGYRLAPEHPFPAGLDDAWEASMWAATRYRSEPLVVAGDSAGANESDGLHWPRRDGLKWPHFASVVVRC